MSMNVGSSSGNEDEVISTINTTLAEIITFAYGVHAKQIIGAPAWVGGASLGTVAVIAPTRIQYQEMIQAVRYIARLSERLLEVPAD